VAYREYWIHVIERMFGLWKNDPNVKMKMRWFTWQSQRPNVHIKFDKNIAGNKGVHNLAGWGGPSHFQTTVKYKGMLRTDVINYLIRQYEYESYLEIGVDNGHNFKHIECEKKHGVDPNKPCEFKMTSDEFFSTTNKNYDLIFIDGLHQAKQASRDLDNALKRLNPGGVVVMHDCNPRNKHEQQVPREKGQRIWTGDVWKAFVIARQRDNLEMYVVDCNNGIGVVRPGEQEPITLPDAPLTYESFEPHKKEWLNLKSPDEFKAYESNRYKIHKYKPVSEKLMNKIHGRKGTICETLREVYREIDDPKLQKKVRVCVAMAKSMNKQLHKYKRIEWAAQQK